MKYKVLCNHLSCDGWVKLPVYIEAESKPKAVYKAFKSYREAFRPSGPNLFMWFVKHVLIKVEQEDQP